MFEVPSNEEIVKIIVNKDTITTKKPEIIATEGEKRPQLKPKKTKKKKGIESA